MQSFVRRSQNSVYRTSDGAGLLIAGDG